jgi:hypothetical protein
MVRHNGFSPEERARITEIQDLLIELYVERKDAMAAGMRARANNIEQEINDLLEEKADIEKSPAVF